MQKNELLYLKQTPVDKFKILCSKIFLFLCIILCVFTIYINVTYSIAPVSGTSMSPLLNGTNEYQTNNLHDRVVLNYIKAYHKGDIIVAKKVFDHEEENYIYVIKRLIAVGGDKVKINSEGTVFVNDVELKEDYVSSVKTRTYSNFNNLKTQKPGLFEDDTLIVPKGYVFYLGDNRAVSADCSSYGPVKEENVIAKVDFIIKAGENAFASIIKQIFKF